MCTSTSTWLCCSTEVQTGPWSSDVGVSMDTVVRMTQHPKRQDHRDFILTPIQVHGQKAHCRENKRKRDER